MASLSVIAKCSSHRMEPCDHEETNTWMVVHFDTDVLAIIIHMFHALATNPPTADMWMAFGMERTSCIYISTLSVMLWEETD